MSRTKSAVIGFAIFAIGIIVFFLMTALKPEPPKKPAESNSPLVEVLRPEPQTVQLNIKAHGVVKPRTETVLISEVTGVVQRVSNKFVAGGLFEKGEMLLQIDPTDHQVAFEQAKARLAGEQAKYAQEKAKADQAKKEWDLTGRSRENAPVLALREPFLLEAKANVESAQADLKKAEQKLARTVIKAPYSGMVKKKLVDVGQYVSVGTQLGETFAIDYAEIRLPLTDQELAFIDLPVWGKAQAQKTPVSLSANYAGKIETWQGEVVRMEGVVDEQSRVHYLVARVNDPYQAFAKNTQVAPLKVGTFVTASIQGITLDNLIKLPREAFRDMNNVLVSDQNNRLASRQLEVIRSEAQFSYVKSGLNDGDRVILTAIESPVQGMMLRIQGDPAEPAATESDQQESESVSQ